MKQLAAALALSLAAATPAVAGPPWITVEVRPHGFQLIVVHTFHHGTANPMPLRGTAEGLVDGRRVSLPLRFDAIAEGNNSYAVAKEWGESGVWVLNIATGESHGGAAAVVLIDRNGAATVLFPRMFTGQSREATTREVSTMLIALEEGGSPALARTGWLRYLAIPVLLLVMLVYLVTRLVSSVRTRWRSARAQTASA